MFLKGYTNLNMQFAQATDKSGRKFDPMPFEIHVTGGYCKFGNFRENFIFAKSVKRHICDFQNSQLGHGLPISVNDRVVSTFRENFFSRNFAYAKLRENKTLAKLSEFTVYRTYHKDADNVLVPLKRKPMSNLENYHNDIEDVNSLYKIKHRKLQ